jgi:hypothetical protein
MPSGARNGYRKKTMHRMHARPLYAPAADSHDGAHVHAAGYGIDDVCFLQVPRTASTASAAHTLRYPARDETSKATPSAAELEMVIRQAEGDYCRHRRQRACPARYIAAVLRLPVLLSLPISYTFVRSFVCAFALNDTTRHDTLGRRRPSRQEC